MSFSKAEIEELAKLISKVKKPTVANIGKLIKKAVDESKSKASESDSSDKPKKKKTSKSAESSGSESESDSSSGSGSESGSESSSDSKSKKGKGKKGDKKAIKVAENKKGDLEDKDGLIYLAAKIGPKEAVVNVCLGKNKKGKIVPLTPGEKRAYPGRTWLNAANKKKIANDKKASKKLEKYEDSMESSKTKKKSKK